MKMKNLMWVATSCLVALTACNKDEIVDNPTGSGGEEATIQLAITNPTAITYATDAENATDAELAFNTVDVFIYDENGILDKHYQLDGQTDFSETTNGSNTYVSDKKLQTTEGLKEIYVGVNLPDAIRTAIGGRSTKVGLAEAINVTLAQLTGTSFAMFNSDVVLATLVPITAANPENKITVPVCRMVAKVSVEKAIPAGGYEVDGGEIEETSLQWNLRQLNTKMFPMQQRQGNTVLDPNHEPGTYPAGEFIDHPTAYINVPQYASTVLGKDVAVKYAIENTQRVTNSNQMTYVSVTAIFVPTKYADADGNDKPVTPAAGDDFWTVSLSNGYMYYFNDLTDAQAFSAANSTLTPVISAKYEGGKCYYEMYLNIQNANNPYGVLRNEFYRTKITRINGIGDPGPGPGDIKKTANIDLTVDIEPWNAISEDYQLRKR